jgi:hypothetical protein
MVIQLVGKIAISGRRALRILFRNMSFMVRAKALSEFDVSDIALKGDVNSFIFAS